MRPSRPADTCQPPFGYEALILGHRKIARTAILLFAVLVSFALSASPLGDKLSDLKARWPSAANTGPEFGTILRPINGTVTMTENGQVLENVLITGNVIIEAENVTLRNCKIVSETPYHVISADAAIGFTLDHCEIDGNGSSSNGVLGEGTFLGNYIHGVENGLNLTGPSTVKDNYIHIGSTMMEAPHYDGIEINGGGNHVIVHNTIENTEGQTAAIMMNNEFSGMENIVIDDNFVSGGGYTIYCDSSRNSNIVKGNTIRIRNNYIVQGTYGPFALYDSGIIPTENYNALTGKQL